MANAQMTNYIMPTSMDLPPIRVYFDEQPVRARPAGAKGIGELPMDGPAPAIVNAIAHAIGADPRTLPLTPEVADGADGARRCVSGRSASTAASTATEVTLTGHPLTRLLDALRRQLQLTGTKEGCGEGECGACSRRSSTAQLVNSCLFPLLHARGATITTIEGVADDGRLHAVQEAFVRHGGAQCGICTPGMVLAAVTLLERTPEPSATDVRVALAGNLCRCTGYMRIFEAVLAACRAS